MPFEMLTVQCLKVSSCAMCITKNEYAEHIKNNHPGTSLVVQWLIICLPMQGTWVRALVQEDPTCCRATKPVRHNYWPCALEPLSHNYWARMPGTRAPQREATAMRSPCTAAKSCPHSPQLEKAHTQQRRPNAAKKKIKNIHTINKKKVTIQYRSRHKKGRSKSEKEKKANKHKKIYSSGQ